MTTYSVRLSKVVTLLLAVTGSAALLSAEPSSSAGYAGSQACKECHNQVYTRFANSKMAKVMLTAPRNDLEKEGCESCHGPASRHIEVEKERDAAKAAGRTYTGPKSSEFIIRFGKDSPLSMVDQNARCLQCHEKGQRLFWEGSTHESRGIGCTSCHKVHGNSVSSPANTRIAAYTEPLTGGDPMLSTTTETETCLTCHPMRRAQLQRSSHMPVREGSLSCGSCHNPHGTPNAKLLKTATVNETCYQCHPERRGPFLWEHAPAMENCLTCHDAHGSANPQLLKTREPRLCEECHDVSGHNTQPLLATSHYVFNRSCTNCHSQVHGSNSPAGSRLQR